MAYPLLPHLFHKRHGTKSMAVLDATAKHRVVRPYIRLQVEAALNLVKRLDRAPDISAIQHRPTQEHSTCEQLHHYTCEGVASDVGSSGGDITSGRSISAEKFGGNFIKNCSFAKRCDARGTISLHVIDAPELCAREDDEVERINADLLAVCVPCLHGVV